MRDAPPATARCVQNVCLLSCHNIKKGDAHKLGIKDNHAEIIGGCDNAKMLPFFEAEILPESGNSK